MELTGKVKTGKKEAQKFLSLKPYQDKIEEKTGFTPFPGTLNIKVEKEEHQTFKQENQQKRIDSFQYEGKDYGGLELYKVKIQDLDAALLDIDRADHEDDIAEIIAPEKLRAKLDLEDGDKVKIHG